VEAYLLQVEAIDPAPSPEKHAFTDQATSTERTCREKMARATFQKFRKLTPPPTPPDLSLILKILVPY